MATSYSRNKHFIIRNFWLTVLKMSIKTVLFFFLFFCCIITPISVIKNHYRIMENLKNNREKIEQLRTKYPKNHENSKNS